MNSQNYRVGQNVYDSEVVIADRPQKWDRVAKKYIPDEALRLSTWEMANHLGLKRTKAETAKNCDSDKVLSGKKKAFDDRVWAAWCEYWHPLEPVAWRTKKQVKAMLQKWND